MNMGRPLEFDPDKAVDQAMQVFWSQGFDATSLQDLLRATRLSKSSLYQAFGSKQILFDRCVDLYLDNLAEQMRVQLARANSGRRFIEDAFRALPEKAGSPEAARGCLLWNTALEFGQRDAKVARRVASGIDRFAKVFTAAVKLAQQQGEISSEKDASVLGRYLLSSMSGLRAMLKGGADVRQAESIVQTILQSLD